jgi:hypothetical protein
MSQFGSHVPHTVTVRPRAFAGREGGTQWEFHFPNGYGASVINDGYGRDAGLFELAVLEGSGLTYNTPITNDVLGHLTEAEVADVLDRIAALEQVPA